MSTPSSTKSPALVLELILSIVGMIQFYAPDAPMTSGGRPDGSFAGDRFPGGDHLHGAPRPRVGCSLPILAGFPAQDAACGYYN